MSEVTKLAFTFAPEDTKCDDLDCEASAVFVIVYTGGSGPSTNNVCFAHGLESLIDFRRGEL